MADLYTFDVHGEDDHGEPTKKVMALYPSRDTDGFILGVVKKKTQFRAVVQWPFPTIAKAEQWAQQAFSCGEKFEA